MVTEPPAEPAAPPRRLARPTPVCAALLGMNVAVFVAQQVAPGRLSDRAIDPVAAALALDAPYVWAGEFWRLLTAAFIHFGPLHLLFNMMVLWDVGRPCERVLGAHRFVAVYLISALGGTVASSAFTAGISGGASGALFGVAGAFLALVLLDRERVVFRQREVLRGLLVRFLAINLALQFAIPHIDIAAHMGGLLAGAAAGSLLFGLSPVGRHRSPAIRVGAGAALALLGLGTLWALHPVGLPRFERYQAAIRALGKMAPTGRITPDDSARSTR